METIEYTTIDKSHWPGCQDACEILGIHYRGLDHVVDYAFLAERFQCNFTPETSGIVRRAATVLIDAGARDVENPLNWE